MEISSVIEKLGRAIFEAPFGGGRISKDAPELAEIRLAVLDAVKIKSHRAGGKSVRADRGDLPRDGHQALELFPLLAWPGATPGRHEPGAGRAEQALFARLAAQLSPRRIYA